ncbi:MAG: hypothetical protein KKB74_00665, partial [Bacteroidetes bacterium]|nr:hypothetical protein [Bacteroidota bacterium]
MKLSVLKLALVFTLLVNMFVLQAFSNNGLVSDKKFLIQQGLSQSRILCILEDERGFMWFGTADGLNRYDGYKMKIFKHHLNDTTHLPNNTIASMVEDSDGNFWIATYNGVALFNPYSETCRTFIETDTNLIALGANKLTSCTIDHQQNIWFGTNGYGVFKMNPKTLKREYFFNSESDSLKMNDIQSVFVDSKNRLWMGYFFVDTLSVYQIDQDTLLKFSVVRNENAKDEAYRNYSFYEDADQRIWTNASEYVHGNTELFYCENGESTFRNYKNIFVDDYDGSYSIITASITSITGDKDGQLYAASLSGGVFKFRFGEAPTPYYAEDELNNIPIVCTYIGKNNLIWVGTNGYGVVFSYPKYTDFNLINNVKNNSFKVVSIRAFMEDENHYWVGGYDGLVRMSKNFYHIETVYNSNVYSIANHESDPNFLWIGSEGDGLILFDKRNAKNIKFNLQIPGKNYSRIKYVYSVQHISATKLLVGGSDGLVCINPITGSVKEYPYQDASKIAGAMTVRSINSDREGNILIGYINGLIGVVDFENETVEKFSKIADLRSLSYYDPINCIYHDEQYNYWIASSIGLIKYDATRDTLIVFSEQNGLPNSHLYGILPDDDNNLWMSTNNGLSCYVIEENIFKNFDMRDGLQNNEFNTGAYFKAANGLMFFGGISGVNYFNPSNIRQNSIQPVIQITDIKVNNQYLTLSKEEIATHQLEIQPDEEIITIEFSGLSFINNNKNKYKYKINELNKDWIDLGNYHQITFNNLAPGKYTLEILASNNHGLWLDKPYAFSIVVLPTFFESVFFKWLIGILILVLIFVGIQLRLRQLIKQKRQLQLFADKQTESLVATNDTLKNVIKELKTTTSELE